jgi:tRNA pseudouridine32 synthase / 23S rRNA pseudouridine746 synthase
VRVLHEAPGWLAVDKPSGELVVPGRREDPADCVWRRLEAERAETLWVVHRIDRDTSGVLVFARTADAHRLWSMAFERGTVEKEYLAFTDGVPTHRDIATPLIDGRGRVRIADPREPGAKASRTAVEIVRVWGRIALVRCRPRTGRQHQIRVHLASVGAPLLVDPLYGAPDAGGLPIARLTLHASGLVAPPELGGDEVSSPMPADFVALQQELERRR